MRVCALIDSTIVTTICYSGGYVAMNSAGDALIRCVLADGTNLTLLLFESVKNGQAIMEQLMKGNLELALMDPEVRFWRCLFASCCLRLYRSPKQMCLLGAVTVASQVAATSYKQGAMRTKNIHSELVYNISAANSVRYPTCQANGGMTASLVDSRCVPQLRLQF